MLTYSYLGDKAAGFCQKPQHELVEDPAALGRVTRSGL